ncbi:hypothetical protein ACIBCN_18945 [Nocardia sp. NPDC051052]|uniref:hypothetical protein n=1 Tax=Nocardia sp. NPDC051052 TaxID=3364322 RepID=UPI00379E6CB2
MATGLPIGLVARAVANHFEWLLIEIEYRQDLIDRTVREILAPVPPVGDGRSFFTEMNNRLRHQLDRNSELTEGATDGQAHALGIGYAGWLLGAYLELVDQQDYDAVFEAESPGDDAAR